MCGSYSGGITCCLAHSYDPPPLLFPDMYYYIHTHVCMHYCCVWCVSQEQPELLLVNKVFLPYSVKKKGTRGMNYRNSSSLLYIFLLFIIRHNLITKFN